MVRKPRADPEKTKKTTSTNGHISLIYKTLKIRIFLMDVLMTVLMNVLTNTLHEALAHQ